MPKALAFLVCEKLITADDGTVSLISLLDSFAFPAPPGATIPPTLILPLRWTAFTMWQIEPEERGRQFEQRLELFFPSGKMGQRHIMSFRTHTQQQRCIVRSDRFPVGEPGDYNIVLSVREVDVSDWAHVATYSITVVYGVPETGSK